jgi:hypothetical protein
MDLEHHTPICLVLRSTLGLCVIACITWEKGKKKREKKGEKKKEGERREKEKGNGKGKKEGKKIREEDPRERMKKSVEEEEMKKKKKIRVKTHTHTHKHSTDTYTQTHNTTRPLHTHLHPPPAYTPATAVECCASPYTSRLRSGAKSTYAYARSRSVEATHTITCVSREAKPEELEPEALLLAVSLLPTTPPSEVPRGRGRRRMPWRATQKICASRKERKKESRGKRKKEEMKRKRERGR